MKVDNIIQTAKKDYEDSIQSKKEYSLAITTNHKKYVNWLNKEFKDINIVNPNKIVKKTQNKYKSSFNEWV